jgi:hypothetical protein
MEDDFSDDYLMEMDSPHNFKSSTQKLPPVYPEGLDVFDEFEQRFNDFLRSTPYID